VSLLVVAILIALLATGWFAPLLGNRWLAPIEASARRFARRRVLTVLSLGVAVILLRVILLPIVPIPVPAVHDEFSYLLAADTFAHGRITNPPHPMCAFFDTFHVLQHPTYASKYPPAPAAAMAIGQLLGHPWIGVLLSMAAMVMAMTWMLQGWFAVPWALLGGVLVVVRLTLFNYWFDSYYNGSVAAIGAALVLGAFPRLLHRGQTDNAILMALGAVILALSRPVEGFFFCVPVVIALSWFLLKGRTRVKQRIKGAILPMSAVLMPAILFVVYYNAKVTLKPFEFPYVVYHHQYFSHPVFVWQKMLPTRHFENAQFEEFFNTFQQRTYPLTWSGWRTRSWTTFWIWWIVYLGPVLTIPLVMLPRVLRDHRMRLPIAQLAVCGTGLFSVVWFQPHYAAPLAAALFVLMVQAMRHLRQVRIQGRPVGIYLSRLVVILALDWVLVQAGHAARYPPTGWNLERARIVQKLQSLPDQHLVLVRYAANHNVHHEWVYNAADIDGARIVWAREIPGKDLQPLLNYYRNRRIWLLEADASPPRLDPYPALERP
jgi:hypothetical protein